MTDSLSFQARAAKRRAELQAARTFDIPVAGYEDIYVARYHPLDYRTQLKIEARHEKVTDLGQRSVLTVADKLINACDGLYGIDADGSLVDLETRWTADAVRELFGIEVPEGATARQALLALYPPAQEMDLMNHGRAFQEACDQHEPQVQDELAGESLATSAVALSS